MEEIKLFANFLITIPKITGKVTTKNIFIDMPNVDIWLVVIEALSMFADLKIIKGTVIILNKLMIAVKDIERATSPFANLVKIFEVTPPGAAAIIINPTANSIGVLNKIISTKAIMGKKIN